MTDQTQTSTEGTTKVAFEAEISKLMNIIVNSLYSNDEVFLRELIANASDALTKVKYHITQDESYLLNLPTYDILIKPDSENNTLTIEDTGIGMTKEDLANCLGTIAKSGSQAYVEMMKASQTANGNAEQIIGQFGMGFYSGFLVADNVTVVSKHPKGTTCKWTSNGDGYYTIEDNVNDDLVRGTKIILHLKDTKLEYLTESRLKVIVKKYSTFTKYPIYLWSKKTRTVEKPVTETTDETLNEVTSEEPAEDKKPETVEETYYEYVLLNEQKAIWSQDKSTLTEDDYRQFYKSLASRNDEYFAKNHFRVDGKSEFTGLIYIPKVPPMDMFKANTGPKRDVKLYVKGVFITSDNDKMVPEYLTFLRGIIDSQDLPLNVSREMLQQNGAMRTINRTIVKKTLDMLEEMDEELYLKFYNEYYKSVKLAIHEEREEYKDTDKEKTQKKEFQNRFINLLRYLSLTSKDKPISLKKYVEQMKEDQKDIYYITGATLKSVENAPFLEALKARNYDVLLMTDPVDEYALELVKEYDSKKLVCVTKENFKLDAPESDKETSTEFKPFCDYVKKTLGNKVEKVVLTYNLVDSPCAIATSEHGYTANMQRVINNQTLGTDNAMAKFYFGRKTLELNPNHDLVKSMKTRFEANDESLANVVNVVYNMGLVSSGFEIENSRDFVESVYKELMPVYGVKFTGESYIEEPTQDNGHVEDDDDESVNSEDKEEMTEEQMQELMNQQEEDEDSATEPSEEVTNESTQDVTTDLTEETTATTAEEVVNN